MSCASVAPSSPAGAYAPFGCAMTWRHLTSGSRPCQPRLPKMGSSSRKTSYGHWRKPERRSRRTGKSKPSTRAIWGASTPITLAISRALAAFTSRPSLTAIARPSWNPRFSAENRAHLVNFFAAVAPIRAVHGCSYGQLMIAWSLSNVDVALCGARTPAQAQDNAGAGAIDLAPAELHAISAAAHTHLHTIV